jgi:hypothetical protein
MPVIIIPPPLAPYPNLEDILDLTRVKMNDAIASIGGDILTDIQPFTQVMANAGWRALQAFLANMGYSRFKKPLILPGMPIAANHDPASQCQLTWSYYFDGTSFFYPPDVNVFPQDFILPLRVWERLSNTQMSFIPMEMAVDRLPDFRKVGFNRFWLWENDTLYLPGSVFSMDLKFEYASFLPNFATSGTVQWFQQPVPVMRCEAALAFYICAEAAEPRNDLDGAPFILKAEQAARLIFNKEVSQKQRRAVSRQSYAGNYGRSGGGYGY